MCLIKIGHGFYRGNTCELSDHTMAVHIPALIYPGMNKPKQGETAMLTVDLQGVRALWRKRLKIPCKIVYLATIIVGLQFDPQFLSEEQQKIYAEVLDLQP
jgi:hypothetical protein